MIALFEEEAIIEDIICNENLIHAYLNLRQHPWFEMVFGVFPQDFNNLQNFSLFLI